MKIAAFFLCTCLLGAADSQPKALTIPASAVESEPGAFHFTDAQGVKWVYYKTPFGISRGEDRPVFKPAVPPEGIKATEDGDTIRFERPGPFGVYHWQRKKSELNEMEQAVWNGQHHKPAEIAVPPQE